MDGAIVLTMSASEMLVRAMIFSLLVIGMAASAQWCIYLQLAQSAEMTEFVCRVIRANMPTPPSIDEEKEGGPQ